MNNEITNNELTDKELTDKELTKETYRSNHNYMSYSRLVKFLECEAAAVAGYREPSSVAQLVGSYVDAYYSDELEEFKQEHPEIFNSRTGALKSDFSKADELIERINSDEQFTYFMSGEKQRIMVGEIDGLPFKIKMDSYKEDEFIVDLKVMKDFKPVWSDRLRSYANFIEAYSYDIELAIFQEIVRQNTGKKLPTYIAAITKESPSDVGIFKIPQRKLDEAIERVHQIIPRVKDIMEGKVAPHRCNCCSYCRSTKKANVLDYDLVGMSGDQLREVGLDCDDPIYHETKERGK